ncbi:MAG: integrase core domain-containing protein [Anaerolineae bacterium]|nr:integrase core domain-containing protein [Anaerolineae bacterium]
MATRTTPVQRQRFCDRHQNGQTYEAIAASEGVSPWTVRYWCRRERDGRSVRTVYRREPAGLLRRFDPKVRYCLLRLRLEHPRWGPNRLLAKLRKRPSLRGLPLPSEASIGRYLHQWPRFRRPSKQAVARHRPNQPTQVHQRWQTDFKLGIAMKNGTWANLYTVRDPFGEACIGAFVFPAGPMEHTPLPVDLEQVRSTLRTCFARWGTLPDEIQTDGEAVLVGHPAAPFPTVFTLWLKGLGIEHLVIRPGRPTDNAEVERCHRTVTDYAIVGNEGEEMVQLQQVLDEAVYELTYELPSRAKGCKGQPPISAHPELLQPRRPYQPDHELALFDLQRVDAYLATFTWQRTIGKTGQTEIGRYRYSVGRTHARQQVKVHFSPNDRHFVFSDSADPEVEICRRPAKGLDVSDLTGLAPWPTGLGIQQLPLPLFIPEGVNC